MKIEKTYPPNYKEIIKHFPIENKTGVVFTYGDTLYAPDLKDESEIPDNLQVHEETHTRQQGDNPELWWSKYFSDTEFRKEQEVEAYHNQYMFERQKYGNRSAETLLVNIASDLCSPMYNLNITFSQAEKLIKKYVPHQALK